MAAAAVDTHFIATSYDISHDKVETLLNAPTVELVKGLLERLVVKAKEHEKVKASKLKTEIELEGALRSNETRTRSVRANVDRVLKESEELRQKLNEQEAKCTALESELEATRSSTSKNGEQTEILQSRVSTLEAANRDTVSLLDAKSIAYDKLAVELQEAQQKATSLRHDASSLESKFQEAENASMSAKFREQALQQEIDLLKKHNEWYEVELNAKSQEHAKYRKDKAARIAELQRLNEDANNTIDSLKRTEGSLRARIDELMQKADEALLKVQQLQESATNAEESFKVELDGAHRLAELQKQSADTARARLQEVQVSLENTKEDAAAEVGQLQAELETERSDRQTSEQKLSELELQVEKLEATAAPIRDFDSTPSTPRAAVNGSSPGRNNSSSLLTPNMSKVKGSLSFTQLYSEYAQTKSELETERRRNQKLSSTIDDMISNLEKRQPEIEELRIDHDRLQEEVAELSNLLEEASQDRQTLLKDARNWEGQVGGLGRENDILRQQLRDLSAQVKILLIEMRAKEEGFEALGSEEQLQLERAARGEIPAEELDDPTDTGRFISQRLTIFRNVVELQEQNVKLLRVTRELGEKMEGEEARMKQSEQAKEREELANLRERVNRHQDEMKSMITQSQSYIRERDMFRRMLAHRGQIPANADLTSMFANSVSSNGPPATPSRNTTNPSQVEQTPHSKELADYSKLLKEMQSHFDAYRNEAATDQKSLKEQLDRVSREKGALQGDMARLNSHLTLAHERYEMLQANYGMMKAENQELQKRTQSLAEVAAKQDMRTQQAAEDLVETKALLDSSRNEMANLKAERSLWKNIENRMNEDNQQLLEERSRLNKMLSDLQNLQNERELSDSESRRRLQSRIDTLETELQSTKRKLDDEQEEGRKTVLRREFEQEQSRNRVDDLVSSLGRTREELVAAKTKRDLLQSMLDDMKAELSNSEEKVKNLQSRPVTNSESDTQGAVTAEKPDNADLSSEVTALQKKIEAASRELQAAREDVEQYKAISQASEEELHSLNESHDQYRQETDKQISEKDSKIKDLEQRVTDISSELSATNTELSSLRTHQEENLSTVNAHRQSLESEVSRLRAESERYAETMRLHQQDLKTQAGIAQQAQQSYETELVKHAEAAKTLQQVRLDYNELRTQVAEIRAESQAAKSMLTQNEESWTETKERYERELAELKERRESIAAQNRLLHEQLDSVSTQIAELKRKRGSDEGAAGNLPTAGDSDTLGEVIRYLRREKDIIEVQHELSVQEARRLKQQLDYTQTSLDQVRETLAQERRSQNDKAQEAASHTKLVQTINELNLFRESSTTLRNEARQAQTRLEERNTEVEKLLERLQPLEARVQQLESEVEVKEGEIKLLQEDRDRWQQRTQNILQKYDRVDPAEMEALKSQLSSLEAEKNEWLSSKEALQEEVNGLAEKVKEAEEAAREEERKIFAERRERLVDQFKGRSKELNTRANNALKEKADVAQELSTVKDELEKVKSDRDRLETVMSERDQAAADASNDTVQQGEPAVSATAESEEGEVNSVDRQAVEEQSSKANETMETYQTEIQRLQAEIEELKGQLEERDREITTLSTQLAEMRKNVESEEIAANTSDAGALSNELAAARTEIEKLRGEAADSTSTGEINEETEAGTAQQVEGRVALIKAELEQKHADRVRQVEEQYQKRTDQMKTQLSTKLKEGRESIKQDLQKEHEEAMQRLRENHAKEIDSLRATHQQELAQIQSRALASNPPAEVKASDGNTSGPSAAATTPGVQTPTWPQSESGVKDFIANSPTAKGILRQNVLTKLNQEREAIAAKVREEQDKVMAARVGEVQKKADVAKEQAVIMESKRYSVKISMAENKARQAIAKIEVVEKAAKDTPQRPVVEVWAIAKDTKAPPPPPQANAASQSVPNALKASQTASPGAARPVPPMAAAQGQISAPQKPVQSPSTQGMQTGTVTQPSDQAAVKIDTATPDSASAGGSAAATASTPTGASNQQTTPTDAHPLPIKPMQQTQQAERAAAPKAPSAGGAGPASQRMSGPGTQSSSAIPRGGSGIARGGRGRGGIPTPHGQHAPANAQATDSQAGASQRGQLSLPRGGSGGGGRGGRGRGGGDGGGGHGRGQPTVQTGNAQHGHNMASPGTGRGVNPAARQFVPGTAKRTRDEAGDGGEVANAGKRARGGGPVG